MGELGLKSNCAIVIDVLGVGYDPTLINKYFTMDLLGQKLSKIIQKFYNGSDTIRPEWTEILGVVVHYLG